MYRLRFLAIEIYKCAQSENTEYLNDLFNKKSSVYNLRDDDIFHQPEFNTITYGYRSFAYYGAKLWNTLPNEIKKSLKI